MNGDTSKPKQEEKARSYIHIEFIETASALFDIGIENVSPNQISAAIGYLDAYSKVLYTEGIVQNLRRAQEQQISVPKPNIQVAK
jgi:hypothetical protein